MAKKAEEKPVTNSNINNNNNHINIDVKVEHPKPVRKYTPKKKPEPNWIFKAAIIALIGFIFSLLLYYLTNHKSADYNPAVIENGSPAIKGEKQTN